MAQDQMNVCLIGDKFMGRAHSNAYLKVNKFFEMPLPPAMHTVVGRNPDELGAFARRWGWQNTSTDWKAAVRNPEIGLVDVTSPNNAHMEMAIAALEAGKHVACEKPLAGTLADARQMRDAARKAKKCKTFAWYCYRRVPAVALAYQLAREGRLGRNLSCSGIVPPGLGRAGRAADLAVLQEGGRLGIARRPWRARDRHGPLYHRR